MSQTAKKISISQGLKLVERLTRLIDEEQSELTRVAQPVVVSFSSEKGKVDDRQTLVAHKIADIDAMFTSLIDLRSIIGTKNSEIGLHAMLAKQAVLRKQKSGLEALGYSQLHQTNAIDLSLVDEALTRLERKDELPKIQVKVLSTEKVEEINDRIRDIDRQIMVINDEVHRLNGVTQFILELPAVVAEKIGLFA